MQELTFLSPQEALPLLLEGAILVDLRDDYYKNGRTFAVPQTISIYYKDFTGKYLELPHDRMLILADYVGLHSKEIGYFLLSHGYDQVASLVGGIVDWEKDGMPTIIDNAEELAGSCVCQLKKRKRIKE